MSPSWEENEALRRAFASRSEQVPAEHRCPEPDRIWAALSGGLPAAERRDVVRHTAICPACAEDFRLAADLLEVAGERMPRAREEPVAVRTWWLRGLAAAAAVVLVAVGLASRFGEAPPSPPAHRTGGEETVRSLLEPGQVLPRDNVLLRWSGPAGARYDVEVTTYPDLELIVREQGLEAAELRVAPEDLADLPRGARLLWQVDAVLPDGTHIDSPAFDVRLEP